MTAKKPDTEKGSPTPITRSDRASEGNGNSSEMSGKKLYLVKGELQHGMCNGKQTKHRWLEQVKIMTEITPDEVEKYLKELLDGYIEDYDNGDISKEDFLDSFPLTVKLRMLKKLEGLHG